MAGKKTLQRNATTGQIDELKTVNTAADAGVSGDIVALSTGAVIDPALLNAVATSAGVADAAKVVQLNAAGILADSVVNSKATSAGAADAAKIPKLNASGVLDSTIVNSKIISVGAGDSGKIVALDASGRIDTSVLPTGIGADTAAITTSEALAAGDYVNTWNSAGFRVRKADWATAGKEAHGFVLAAFASGAVATVYFEGTNTQVTGQVGGVVFGDPTQPGKGTATVPSTPGQISQIIGFATTATSVNFQNTPPIRIA